jgi:type II secretory pathway component PulF
MIYPIILLVTSVVIFVFLITYALPKIAKIFSESGINPPLFSRVVFSIGLFVNAHAAVFGFGAIIVLLFSIYFFWKNQVGRHIAQRILGGLPIIKKVTHELAVQRFAATTSSLMKAGLPIVQTINIAADTVNVDEFKFSLRRISEEGLAKGLTVSEAFKREVVFPKLVTNLIAVSEKAGHLEDVLETLSNFYATRVEAAIKSLVSFLEPVLLLSMGLIVGLVAISIIVPIYQLTSQF